MVDWRNLKVGEKVTWIVDEFDGHTEYEAIVTDVTEERAIAEADGMHLWIDDDTADMFSR